MSDLNEIESGQLCQLTIESLYQATGGLKYFPGLLKKIIRTKAWERRVSKGRVIELASLRELITEKPIRGWGEDPKKIEAVIRDDPEALAMYREAMVEKPGGYRRSDEVINNNIINETEKQGTSRAYSIARVQKSCDPEVVKQVMTGKLSPNAALIQAGIRENRQVYIPREPQKAVEKLRKQFGDEFVRAFADAARELL